jgi:hypothetical protein
VSAEREQKSRARTARALPHRLPTIDFACNNIWLRQPPPGARQAGAGEQGQQSGS